MASDVPSEGVVRIDGPSLSGRDARPRLAAAIDSVRPYGVLYTAARCSATVDRPAGYQGQNAAISDPLALSPGCWLVQLKEQPMKPLMLSIIAISIASAAIAQSTQVTPLFTHDLPGIVGKEGLMLTVEYPPGGADPIHRHDANVFVYVLEGSVIMQVEGKEPVTLHTGQTFYEGPTDVHLVGRNASQTERAKFLAFLVKDKDAPPVLPAR